MNPALKFELYKDAGGGYRWRARSSNGRIVADGGESYKRRWGARHAAVRFVAEVGQLNLNAGWLVEK